MAENKKSFIAYADWKETFDALDNEKAGELIKHIFAYVNDENPVSEDMLINAVFANIKHTLKRDLKKWEKQHEQRKKAGKKSAEVRQRNSTVVNGRSVSSTDSVSVNDISKDIYRSFAHLSMSLEHFQKLQQFHHILYIYHNLMKKQNLYQWHLLNEHLNIHYHLKQYHLCQYQKVQVF